MVTIPLTFFLILLNLFLIPVIIFYFYALYKLFEKCNVTGWKALIPFYNTLVETRIAGVNWWYLILYVASWVLFIDGGAGLRILCALTVLFIHSIISYNLCKRLNNGHNSLMVDFLLLTFIPFIYLPVMAFNESFTYDPNVEVTPNAYIDEIQTSGYMKTETKKTRNNKKKLCDSCGEPLSNQNHFCPNCGKKID